MKGLLCLCPRKKKKGKTLREHENLLNHEPFINLWLFYKVGFAHFKLTSGLKVDDFDGGGLTSHRPAHIC